MILDFSKIEAQRIENFKGGAKEIFTKYIHTVPDTNITMVALRNYFKEAY